MSSGKGSGEIRRLLRRLFRIVRQLVRLGVNPFLILAVVFLALSRTSGRAFGEFGDGFDMSGSGSGSGDD